MANKNQQSVPQGAVAVKNSDLVLNAEGRAKLKERSGDDILLQRIPLAVLLPTVGMVNTLHQSKDKLQARYDLIRSNVTESREDSEAAQLAELGMLTQVLQWLDEL